jgi:hypothetical protein
MEVKKLSSMPTHQSSSLNDKKANTRLVNDYVVFLDEFLGKGQYGSVCKARHVSEVKKPDAKIYACKTMEIVNITAKEMSCIEKEVEIHSRVKTPHCIQLY